MAKTQRLKGLYRRGNVWWYRYTAHAGGPQVRVSLHTTHEGEAIMRALEKEQEAPLEASGEFKIELERYFADGLASKRLSPFTVHSRRHAIANFQKATQATRLGHLTLEAVQRWVVVMRTSQLAETSVGAYFAHLQGFCSWLVAHNKLRENPCKRVKFGKQVIRSRKTFRTKDEIRIAIDQAPDDEMRFILYAGFHAGMRSLEIIEARPEWFRLAGERGCVSIAETPTYRPKDKEERTVPLTAEFQAFLRRYLPTLPDNATWAMRPLLKKKQGRLRRTTFARRFKLYMEAIGLPCSPHDMRRSFVSNKLAEDSSLIFKAARWTGTDVVTLQKHYAHLLADDKDIEAGV